MGRDDRLGCGTAREIIRLFDSWQPTFRFF